MDSGQPADVVAFSTTPDMTRLVKDGLVSKDWNANPEQGFSSDSVVVFVVRKGNPKHITGWDDLAKPGVDVITPNPSTSGSARWNILAGYGAQLKEGKTPAQALAYVRTLLTKNVSVQDSSASSALQTFTSGKGDVLLDYESDAIAAEKAGDAVQYIVPKQTILIQTPIAVLAKSSHATQAKAFVNWQWTPAGQAIWAKEGYRPVLASVAKQYASKFPTPGAAVHDRLPGRLDEGQDRVLRPQQRVDHQDRAGGRSTHCLQLAHTPRRPSRRPPPAPVTGRAPRGAWPWPGHALSERDRADPAVRGRGQGARAEPGAFWASVTNSTVLTALAVTLGASLAVAAIGSVMGTIVAWVLVRDQFPGKRVINALIDLPFALPTVVAGLTLLALYGPDSPFGVHLAYTRAIVLVALLFVTLPFVVRSVQPVLIELDKEVEEAAASLGASDAVTFRRVVLPALRPAILSGAALAFARSVGEIGSLVLIVGKVQIASIVIFADIESDAPQAAASLSLVLMILALIVLFLMRRLGGRVAH